MYGYIPNRCTDNYSYLTRYTTIIISLRLYNLHFAHITPK